MPTSMTADGVTLSTFAKRYLDPAFKAAGARKKGRRYEFVNDLGDVSWFDLYSRGWGDGEVGFDAGVSVTPQPATDLWGWQQHDEGNVDYVPSYRDASLWGTGVTAPDSCQILGRWGFRDEASAALCGSALADALADWVLPVMLLGQDRHALLAAIEAGTLPNARRGLDGTPEKARVILTVDEGAGAELEAALAAVARDGDEQCVRWARMRLDQVRERTG